MKADMNSLSSHAQLPNTLQYTAKTSRGDYLIQVAWPQQWSADRVPHDERPVNTLYVVDGNAYFYTAVDITRRLEFTNAARTVVVAIGYPPSRYVYDWRRGPDLTPPCEEYDMPLDSDGNPRTDISFGEAHKFLAFIKQDVITHVEGTLFRHVQLGRRALYGHSYGGIFSLTTLFTRPETFETIIAASPVVWWNKDHLTKVLEPSFTSRDDIERPVSLIMAWGSMKQDTIQEDDESEDDYKTRLSNAEEDKMRDSVTALGQRLRDCRNVKRVAMKEFVGEDHGSAAVAGLQYGIRQFLFGRV
ncbi:Alpha/Beta hydrolase protein [Emericellopsis atlantica]|uniref:Alpha/Beta hydrolase protein n=1 Tax=Emericellopsis atlantica TaxID=2614577 RepID=A0A9P8CLG2_9HYPO|nr:Alpha/Beta hydrolase protein [Emericellopsis atlantica]KAG9251594.1 Alpha/Beta hydrolase protein [Emericellopsis atlantica]